MASNESALLKAITQYLEFQNWPVYRMNSGTFQDARTGSWIRGQGIGTPDLCVGYFDKTVRLWLLAWIEVKDKSRLSDAQISFLRRVHKLGCPWLVARSIDDVERWMRDRESHGAPNDTKDILDDSRKFVPSAMKSKKSKLGADAMLEFEMWSRRGDKPS